MNIAIYGRNFGNSFSGMLIQLFEELKQSNVNIYIDKKFNEFISTKVFYYPEFTAVFEKELPQDVEFEFFLSIGGDGTFLESATIVKDRGIPILGFNTGRLGFLSYVNSNNLLWAIKQILDGKYSIDQRMVLEVECDESFYGNNNFCLNEFALQKRSRLNMIKLKVYADDNYINTYWSDGLIIATPTGSTAYSLSCGGPIVAPHSDVILITPIANHNLTVRPLVLSGNTTIKILIESNHDKVLASLDYRAYSIKKANEISIKKANFNINFVNLFENTYFSTLRNKLMWGTDLRN
ncbi:MAG: NAD kinase [Bacteroidales bacterium]|nr:NAD kinase [Bacteroidales bacterium]MDD4216456.1 NAD kinase [Bacteroidales bacterium]MDY0141826.1 NAD kinase [Bacteroidales bacterium]